MAAIRRYIVPNTGDYEVENGGPKNDSSHASAIVLRIRMRRGSMPSDPNFGSRIHLVRSTNPAGLRLVEAYAVEAIQDLIDRGLINEVGAAATRYTGGLVRLVLTYRDAAGKPQGPLTLDVAVGAD